MLCLHCIYLCLHQLTLLRKFCIPVGNFSIFACIINLHFDIYYECTAHDITELGTRIGKIMTLDFKFMFLYFTTPTDIFPQKNSILTIISIVKTSQQKRFYLPEIYYPWHKRQKVKLLTLSDAIIFFLNTYVLVFNIITSNDNPLKP